MRRPPPRQRRRPGRRRPRHPRPPRAPGDLAAPPAFFNDGDDLPYGQYRTAKAGRALAAGPGVALVVWPPRRTPKLNGMDHPWRGLKADASADRQYDTTDEHADQAERWRLSLTNAAALPKAGMLSPRFWLRRFRTNFWPRT